MSLNSHEGMPGSYLPITTLSSFPENGSTTPQNPTSAASLSSTLPSSTPTTPRPPTLPCPVPSCSLVFNGDMSHGYLWRHLRRPGIYRRTGDEKDAWLRLHKIEYDRLVATGITPAQRKREANKVRARKVSRAARFESRARDMGITEERLVEQKITIWEGMYAAEQSGDSIGYDAWVLLDFCTSP